MSSTVNNSPFAKCVLTMPRYGRWVAEVDFSSELTLSGSVTLAIVDLTLRGAVSEGGPVQGKSRYRLVGGSGKWQNFIQEDSQRSDPPALVRLATVLQLAAEACGERIEVTSDRQLGPVFVRPRGPAWDIFKLVKSVRNPIGLKPSPRDISTFAGELWYVREDGVTVTGPRNHGPVTEPYVMLERDPTEPRTLISSESISAWTPGHTLGSETIQQTTIMANWERVRIELR